MLGAILGDYIGSPYEFDRNNIKTKDFPLFSPACRFTDDSLMTFGVAKAFLEAGPGADDAAILAAMARCLRELGRRYPHVGYGARFEAWLLDDSMGPYGSYGNGSAMRVSPAAWLFDNLDAVRRAARLSAQVTHDHPEGIRGAEATAAAIFLARTGSDKASIRRYIETEFGYDLSRSCDEIRPGYRHDPSCQGTVPEAVTAFLEGDGFEDVIRTAVSLGGDCDTLTAIAGSMAEGAYGIPEELKAGILHRLPPDLKVIWDAFKAARYH